MEFIDIYQDYEIKKKCNESRVYDEVYISSMKPNRLRDFIKAITNIIFRWDCLRLKKKKIMILGSRFEKIINDQKDEYDFIIVEDSVRAFLKFKYKKNGVVFNSFLWDKKIYHSFITHDMSFVEKVIKQIQLFIKKNGIQIVLMGNDKLFLERAIKIAAESMGIPVVIIQHGIYTIESFSKSLTANTAKHFWVWSDYIKDMYLGYYNCNVDVKTIGYPYEIKDIGKSREKNVLFLGNQYFNLNKDEGEAYFEMALKVRKICEKNNWNFKYRLHPAERKNDKYNKLNVSKNKDLIDDIEWAAVVVGDVSTAMFQASLYRRPVVQLIWSNRSKKTLNDKMYSFTIKCQNSWIDINAALCRAFEYEDQPNLDYYYMYINKNFRDDIRNYINELVEKRNATI